MNFNELGLGADVLKAVSEAGYDSPTPIQKDAIPLILQGRDIIGIAQTGTGKTAAFTLPMIDTLGRGRGRARLARALILEPTRELAMQIADNFKVYGKNHRLSHALLIGGVSLADQFRILARGADFLIATPGRLIDHIERGKVLLSGIEILVIDEADRMLDMGFIPAIERIVKTLPPQRQTLLFSATMPPPIEKLAGQFMREADRIAASKSGKAAENVAQLLAWTEGRQKVPVLIECLRTLKGNAIIFCNRKRDVDRIGRILEKEKFNSEILHGGMPQYRRAKVLKRFRNNEIAILAASNVAARGLDIADVAHVINFDVPQQAEDYVHRIGRTGRAGAHGQALTLATHDEVDFVQAIEKLIGHSIPLHEDHNKPPRPSTSNSKTAKPKKRSQTGRPQAAGRPKAAGAKASKKRHNNPARKKRTRPAAAGGAAAAASLPAFLMNSTAKN